MSRVFYLERESIRVHQSHGKVAVTDWEAILEIHGLETNWSVFLQMLQKMVFSVDFTSTFADYQSSKVVCRFVA